MARKNKLTNELLEKHRLARRWRSLTLVGVTFSHQIFHATVISLIFKGRLCFRGLAQCFCWLCVLDVVVVVVVAKDAIKIGTVLGPSAPSTFGGFKGNTGINVKRFVVSAVNVRFAC